MTDWKRGLPSEEEFNVTPKFPPRETASEVSLPTEMRDVCKETDFYAKCYLKHARRIYPGWILNPFFLPFLLHFNVP